MVGKILWNKTNKAFKKPFAELTNRASYKKDQKIPSAISDSVNYNHHKSFSNWPLSIAISNHQLLVQGLRHQSLGRPRNAKIEETRGNLEICAANWSILPLAMLIFRHFSMKKSKFTQVDLEKGVGSGVLSCSISKKKTLKKTQ